MKKRAHTHAALTRHLRAAVARRGLRPWLGAHDAGDQPQRLSCVWDAADAARRVVQFRDRSGGGLGECVEWEEMHRGEEGC